MKPWLGLRDEKGHLESRHSGPSRNTTLEFRDIYIFNKETYLSPYLNFM